MLLPSRVAGRTLGLRGPDLARGPEDARRCHRLYYLPRPTIRCNEFVIKHVCACTRMCWVLCGELGLWLDLRLGLVSC